MARGIVIQIQGDGESAKKALEMVREEMQATAAQGERLSGTMGRFSGGMEGAVPRMAAASAGLRALEGNFTNNIRAGERFLSMLPGMGELLQTAFPVVGATVLGVALFKLGSEAYHAYQNIFLLKGALDGLNQMDISVAKRVQEAADATESAIESKIQATQGRAAALQQKLRYEGQKGIDLSDFFYNKEITGLNSNLKADYETLYKNVAPQDVPERLTRIRTEVTKLQGALQTLKDAPPPTYVAGPTGGLIQQHAAYVPKVGAYGPDMAEDPAKYYEARLKVATDIQKELDSQNSLRDARMAATQAEAVHAEPKPKKINLQPQLRGDATLAEAQAQAAAAHEKVLTQIHIDELETRHKLIQVSDQQFYDQRLQAQNEEFDKEAEAVRAKQKILNELLAKQIKTKAKPEELDRTKTQMVEQNEQMDRINSERAKAQKEHDIDSAAAAQKAEVAGLRVAADLERERNSGVEARIALLTKEREIQAHEADINGRTQEAANLRALAQAEAQTLRLGELQTQIHQEEEDYQRRIADLRDQAAKDPRKRLAIEKEINAVMKEEAAVLQKQVQAYSDLAQGAGDEYKEKAKDYEEAIDKMNRPSMKEQSKFPRELSQGIGDMVTSISEQALRGKESFHDMTQSMIHDIEDLTLKLLEKKFLLPALNKSFGGDSDSDDDGGGGGFFSSLFGAGGEHHLSGGVGSDMPQVVGEEGEEIWTPPTRGGTYTTNSMLKQMSGAGGGRAPSTTVNVINQSSQPVSAQTSQVSYDSELHQFVQHVVLTDLSSNGHIAQALRSSN